MLSLRAVKPKTNQPTNYRVSYNLDDSRAVGAGGGLLGHFHSPVLSLRGWSGGKMALGKLPVPGRPTV